VSTLSQSFLGSYRLLAPIRTGRYTQVWAAIDDAGARYVALKLLLPEYRSNREQLQTMRHELEVGLKLRHPRCLGAFEMRDSKHGAHLLMDLFPGDNLREVIKRRRDDLMQRFASIVRQAAEGIAHLNAVGYVHLDIKPDNFMLSPEGEVRLIDFALARSLPTAWERFFWKQRQKTIQGTRSYLSPEQIRREPVDFRSDVYSFGCTLFHWAAGVQPYTAVTSDELLKKHLRAAPPNLALENSDAEPEFVDLVRRMMAKHPRERPASIGELVPQLATMRFFRTADEPTAAKPVAGGQNAG
jgi:serine/threonine protein kinase